MNGQEILNDFMKTGPFVCVALGALVLLLIDVFLRRKWERALFASAVMLTAFVVNIQLLGDAEPGKTLFGGLVYLDGLSITVAAIILLGAILVLHLGEDYIEREGISAPGEYYCLYMLAVSGAILFSAAAEFITLFVGLEIMSMSLYCLCASSLRSERSAESALKYFFLGSFSSAFLLFGMALLFGLTGTLSLEGIGAGLQSADPLITGLALGLLLVGFLFKIGAVPFHFWIPDVYQGAPTPVTVFMACVIKASAIVAALRVLWVAFGDLQLMELWTGAIWIISFATMIIGNLAALRQRSVKRMLAYSSVAHVGYLLMGFLAPGQYGGEEAILFYLVSYTVMTIASFGIVQAVIGKDPLNDSADDVRQFNNLGERRPFLAAVMSLALLSLAGLPPGMAGLLGKFYLFNAAVKADFVGLAVVGVLASAVSCYYYLRVIVAMYFVPDTAAPEEDLSRPSFGLYGVISLCSLAIVAIGIFPGTLYARFAGLL